jgi:hypothetical protein
MEFYATTDIPITVADLQRRLTISDLPRWCASIDKVLSDESTSGEIFCVWGTFRVNREEIRGGVRFSLPGCANVLQWTVTTELPPDPQQTVIHLTINRLEQDPDFVETIQQFVDDWKAGIETHWDE